MSKTNYLILHRKSANQEAVMTAVKTVQKEGLDLRVLVPFNKSEKPRAVRQALKRGALRIIAGGGDGTLNAVATTLIENKEKYPDVTLGIMPLGTANDFARGCSLPIDDLTECLRIACTRAGKPIDVGVVGKKYFINVASAGFGAEITASTPVELKKVLGGGAYTLMGLVKVFKLSPYTGRLLIAGEEAVDGEMLFMAVGNNRFAGGGFEVASRAKLDDGLLDLVTLRQGAGFATSLAREIEDPMNPSNRSIQYRQLSEFVIEADAKIHCNLDGEPIYRKKFKFSVLPKHLRVAY